MTEKASYEDVVRFDGTNESLNREAGKLEGLSTEHDGVKFLLMLKAPAEQFAYYSDGRLLGYFELNQAGGLGFEGSGMVHPDHRREGIGLALIEAVRADCVERGRTGFLFVCDEAGSDGRPFALAVGAQYLMSEYLFEFNAALHSASAGGPLTMREATLDDVDDVVRIGMRAFGEDEEKTEFRRRRTKEWLEEPLRVIYIAELDGEPVATSTLFLVPDSADGFINGMAVLPEYQGRGFGRQILLESVDGLVSRGHDRVNIEVQTDNARALGLYESAGFERKTTYAYFRVKAGQAESVDASAV